MASKKTFEPEIGQVYRCVHFGYLSEIIAIERDLDERVVGVTLRAVNPERLDEPFGSRHLRAMPSGVLREHGHTREVSVKNMLRSFILFETVIG